VELSSGKTRVAKHSHGKLYMPLISARTTRLGVLEFAGRYESADEQNPLVTAFVSHLSALLTRWQQEREIEELTLAVAQESKARDEFISLTAHELRSPLTSVKGYAQLLARLARKNPLPGAMNRSVEAIEMQSMRISEMIVTRTIERRKAYHLAHVITANLPSETLVAQVDASRVEQILRDLIDNATRYSSEGTMIEVSLWNEGDSAVISVRDEGSGMAPDEVDHIFEYLYSAPRMRERNISGLGLGLYVSRELAERMGGQLVLYETRTQPPSGSEFRLILPLSGT
jgi:signal transduction histidine kinase